MGSKDLDKLSFEELRRANALRCFDFHKGGVSDWSPTDWACAVAGEVGELCNLIKKRRRGEWVDDKKIADEMADTVAYLDLLAECLEIDLGAAVRRKFNEVSQRIGSSVDLPSRKECDREMSLPLDDADGGGGA